MRMALVVFFLSASMATAQTRLIMRRASYTGTNVPTNGTLLAAEVAVNTNATGRVQVWTSTNGSNIIEVAAQYNPAHRFGTNAWIEIEGGTNLLWIVGTTTNRITLGTYP